MSSLQFEVSVIGSVFSGWVTIGWSRSFNDDFATSGKKICGKSLSLLFSCVSAACLSSTNLLVLSQLLARNATARSRFFGNSLKQIDRCKY